MGRVETAVYRVRDPSGLRTSLHWRVPIRGLVFEGILECLYARVRPDPAPARSSTWRDPRALLQRVGDRYEAEDAYGQEGGSVLTDAEDAVPPAPAEGWGPIAVTRWDGRGHSPSYQLREGTLSFDMGVEVRRDDGSRTATLSVSVDIAAERAALELSLPSGERAVATSPHLELAIPEVERGLSSPARIVCCFNCAWSDYFYGGTGLSGMMCFRGSREEYQAVTTKAGYAELIPDAVTENVDELHLCPEFELRRPGTGYRG